MEINAKSNQFIAQKSARNKNNAENKNFLNTIQFVVRIFLKKLNIWVKTSRLGDTVIFRLI